MLATDHNGRDSTPHQHCRSHAPNEILASICAILFDDGRWACGKCFGDRSELRPMPRGEETYHGRFFDRRHEYFHILELFWGSPVSPGIFRNRKDGVYNFRPVCRRFAVIGTNFTHRSISFGMQNQDLNKLEHIASSPGLGSGVRELKYYIGNFDVEPERP